MAIYYTLMGSTAKETSDKMKAQGFKHVSERTIERLLASEYSKRKADQLVQLQLREMMAADLNTRLHFRQKLIDKLIPTPTTEINISQQQLEVEAVTNEFDIGSIIKELAPAITDEALRRQLRDARRDSEKVLSP